MTQNQRSAADGANDQRDLVLIEFRMNRHNRNQQTGGSGYGDGRGTGRNPNKGRHHPSIEQGT